MQESNSKISILDEIQRIIYGERNNPFTPLEINKLFSEPITSEFNIIIYTAFQRKILDPDISILQIISLAKRGEHIILIALCLRFGADPNMYVNAPKLGTMHILGYIYNTLRSIGSTEVLNTIILMFLVEGSKISLPIFDSLSGKVILDSVNTNNKRSQATVSDWLIDQGYNNILQIGDVTELYKLVGVEPLTLLSILLDKPNLMNRDYSSEDVTLAIRTFSNISLTNMVKTLPKLNYSNMLDLAVDYYNSYSYEKFIVFCLPSYTLINKIITMMKSSKNRLVIQELEKMLLISISNGVELDSNQVNIIGTIGQNTLSIVMKEYEQPYWKKVCKNVTTSNDIPETLRRLAISLNIDPTIGKKAICDNIDSLSKSDKQILVQAAKYRQERRISSNLGTINEFINETNPVLVCRNKNLLQNDPLEYNDIDLAYYRDNQGVVWCFVSDTFESILETGINPYNSISLPKTFILELQHKVSVLKSLDKGSTITTFNNAVSGLFNKDNIREKSNRIDTMIQLGSQYGVTSTLINSLSKQEMVNGLRSIGKNKVILDVLSTSHALITTSDIIIETYKVNPQLVGMFFESILAQRR